MLFIRSETPIELSTWKLWERKSRQRLKDLGRGESVSVSVSPSTVLSLSLAFQSTLLCAGEVARQGWF